MVAIHVPQYEPDEWFEPLVDDPGRRPGPRRRTDPRQRGLDVGRWPEPPPIVLPRRLPDRETRVRRRRLAVMVLVALTVLGCLGLLRLTQGHAVGTDHSPESISQAVYVVQPGDTYWSIAERLAPDKDPRPIVDELRSRNGDGELQVGDRLDLADLA